MAGSHGLTRVELGKPGKFSIDFTAEARTQMRGLKAFEERQVMNAIISNLSNQPFVHTRNRKPLIGAAPSFEFEPPLWELRIDDLRVFYDGAENGGHVVIRSIRRKGPNQTTQEVLS